MRRVLIIGALAAPGLALAHHGWSEYDSSRPLKLTGKVVEGYPNREKAREMRAERITMDGKTVELR